MLIFIACKYRNSEGTDLRHRTRTNATKEGVNITQIHGKQNVGIFVRQHEGARKLHEPIVGLQC